MKGPGMVYLELRTKTLMSHLLEPEDIRILVDSDDLESMLGYLLRTEYAPEISGVIYRPEPSILEAIFYKKAVERYAKYKMIVDSLAIKGNVKELITNYMGRIELENLKRVLRAIHAGKKPTKDILIPTSREISKINIKVLLEAKTIEEYIQLLKETAYHRIVEKWELYTTYKIPLILESALEETYYSTVLSTAQKLRGSKPALEIIGTEIDLKNIWTLLQLFQLEFKSEVAREVIIKYSHKINIEEILTIMGEEGLKGTIKVLQNSPYSNLVEKMYDLMEKGKPDQSYGLILKELRRTLTRNLKGMAIPIAYLLSIDLESRDLSRIALGKYLKMVKKDVTPYISI